jgi:hypothetical protein
MTNTNTQEWGNIELPGISDEVLYKKKWAQVAALQGRKRPDQSAFMKENNPMAGKEHPNKGKNMPATSAKLKGKAKSEEHKKNIGLKRKELGLGNIWSGKKRPDQSQRMKENNPGFEKTRIQLACIHCGKLASLPNHTRWHGDNCKHKPE